MIYPGCVRRVLLLPTRMDPGTKAAGNGFDRRQRIVDFVADQPDKALECIALLLAQGNTHVGQNKQRVRDAVLTETGSPNHPVHRIALAPKNKDSPIGLIQYLGKLQIMRTRGQVSLRYEVEDALRSGIDQAEAMLGVEGKHRRVH